MSVLSGCGGNRLLTGPPPIAMRTAGNQPNEMQLFERNYRITAAGKATVRTHSILKVGSEGTEGSLAVFDGSAMRLTGYEARIVFADGSQEKHSIDDLASSTMSNSRIIAERSLRHVGLKRVPGPGDLIESVSEHEILLPQLGIQFSPEEAGDRVLLASCQIEVPRGDTVVSILMNDTLGTSASITRNEISTIYRFDWGHFQQKENRHRFSKRNDAPLLLAITPGHSPRSWKEFGDWYLATITPKMKSDEEIEAAAKATVNDRMSDTEKMFAIARYCQTTIRYEQVYLEGGDIIPNEAPLIFRHRYGDCKDYSTLMVVMARAVGLNPGLVLCRRGTGRAFSGAIPVSQFNHMIVHLRTAETDFWFDGTNPPEAIGVAADDLINATALLLEPDASRLVTVEESPDNLLALRGRLDVSGDDLVGRLTLRLQGQYAVGFLAARRWDNISAMRSSLTRWIERSIASTITVSDLLWRVEGATFAIDLACRFSNALWRVGSGEYVRFDKIFNRLLPQAETALDSGSVFYYPGYARVDAEITIPAFQSSSGGGEFHWEDRFVIPPGPFDMVSRADFLRKYAAEVEKASRVIQLRRKG